MSGNEANNTIQRAEFNPSDISAFASTGYKNADLLSGAQVDTSTGKYYFNRSATGGGFSLDDMVSAFNTWKAKSDQSNIMHEEYVKLVQGQPGRSATILTPYSGPEAKTILGAPAKPSKTVLG